MSVDAEGLDEGKWWFCAATRHGRNIYWKIRDKPPKMGPQVYTLYTVVDIVPLTSTDAQHPLEVLIRLYEANALKPEAGREWCSRITPSEPCVNPDYCKKEGCVAIANKAARTQAEKKEATAP